MSHHRGATFGVSLGSANCVIAVAHNSTSRQDVIADDNGERSTPIAVAFVNGEQLTGLTAKNAIIRHPRNALSAVMPLLSKDASVHTSSSKMSCIVSIDDNGAVTLPAIDAEQEDRTPAELLDVFMVKLKELLQNAAGEGIVTAICIAVPRYVDQDAVLKAATDAKLVSESVSLRIVCDDAAIAMTALPQLCADDVQEAELAENTEGNVVATAQKAVRDENGLVVVVDWGAHSLCVNALQLKGGNLVHVAGDRKVGFGGAALDKAVGGIAAEGFQRKTRTDPSDDARAMRKLVAAAEGAKVALSQCMTASIEIDAFSNGTDLVEPVPRMRLDMAFDKLGGHTAYKAMLEEVVAAAKKTAGDVPVLAVVVSGGQARVPRCIAHLKQITSIVLPEVKFVAATMANEQAAIGACLVATALSHETAIWSAGAVQAPTLSYNLMVGAAADKVDESAATQLIAAGSALPVTVEIAVANFAEGKEFGLAVGLTKKAGDATAWFGVAQVKLAAVSITVKVDGEVVVTEGQRSGLEDLSAANAIANFKP
jgi:L1 cell adhesion molecule like protein